MGGGCQVKPGGRNPLPFRLQQSDFEVMAPRRCDSLTADLTCIYCRELWPVRRCTQEIARPGRAIRRVTRHLSRFPPYAAMVITLAARRKGRPGGVGGSSPLVGRPPLCRAYCIVCARCFPDSACHYSPLGEGRWDWIGCVRQCPMGI